MASPQEAGPSRAPAAENITDEVEEPLAERFAKVCAVTPLPKHQRAQLPGATEAELDFLVQNAVGEIFMSPDALWKNTDDTREVIASAMRKALRSVCDGEDVDIADGEMCQNLDEIEDASTACEAMGIPGFKPVPELTTLTWGTSQSKRVIDEFNDETERIRSERAKKEAAEEAAVMAKAPKPVQKPPLPKPAVTADPVLWAAQEEAAASSVLRELQSRGKKGLWGSRSSKLKPEAAAEMARARVAAAAAAAVMREHERSGELVRADVVDGRDVLERLGRGDPDQGGFVPMHAQAFREAMSLDARSPGGRRKKRVEFAADTVFSKHK